MMRDGLEVLKITGVGELIEIDDPWRLRRSLHQADKRRADKSCAASDQQFHESAGQAFAPVHWVLMEQSMEQRTGRNAFPALLMLCLPVVLEMRIIVWNAAFIGGVVKTIRAGKHERRARVAGRFTKWPAPGSAKLTP